jgi:uncharacterized RDD family membrane protein YckC
MGSLFTSGRVMCLYSRLMADGTIYCNRCGTQNSALARFCANCGTAFSAELQQAAPPPTAPEVSPQPPSPAWQQAPVSYAAPVPLVAVVRYGGFWMRFVAAVIDGILVELVVLPVGAVVGAVIGLAGSAVDMPGIGIHMVSLIISGAVGVLASWIYEAAMESSSKQATVGKMALGLKVTDLEGRRISFARASGRHFAKYISGLTLLIGYIMAGFTERKQALHDMIVGTLVRRTQ